MDFLGLRVNILMRKIADFVSTFYFFFSYFSNFKLFGGFFYQNVASLNTRCKEIKKDWDDEMSDNDQRLTAEKTVMALEEVLGRLEKAIVSKQARSQSGSSEQADFIHQLEKENRALSRELEVARTNVEKLEERIETLEQAGDSAQKEMGLMIKQLDVLISEQNTH